MKALFAVGLFEDGGGIVAVQIRERRDDRLDLCVGANGSYLQSGDHREPTGRTAQIWPT